VALVFIAVLAVFGWLMISRRLTATLALPLAALGIALVAQIPTALDSGVLPAVSTLMNDVVEAGVTRLSTAIMAVILGAVLAALMNVTGAAERLVRYAAEYAGEDRFRLGLLLLVVIAVLFTTLGGLGAVILVATITLPLMLSLGFEPRIAGGLFLLGLSLGGCLNPMNWALYKDVLRLDVTQIVPYAVVLAAIFFLVACAYLLVYVAGRQGWRGQLWPLACLVLLAALIGIVATRLPAAWTVLKQVTAGLLLAVLAVLALLLALRLVMVLLLPRDRQTGWLGQPDNWLAGASVLVPLLMLLWSSLHASIVGRDHVSISIGILTALATGIVFCALSSLTRDGAAANRVMRALFEGITSGGPAVVLLIGIGLLLKATTLPFVASSFAPWLSRLPVGTPAGFVLVFFLLSPLALYRGPLNLYGMGSGVVGIISGSGVLAAGLIMVAFFAVGMLQGVCDPTNTHNVWIANFCRVPVTDLTRLTVPWVLAIVLLGLLAGAAMFGASFGSVPVSI
jgi:hypothetical protein